MIQVRNGLFETNSSSTHAIVIATSGIGDIDGEHVHFRLDWYGWEHDTLDGLDSRASYLYTAIMCVMCRNENEEKEIQKKISDMLGQFGVTCSFDSAEFVRYGGSTYIENASIDHANECEEFVRNMLNSEWLMIQFLFNNLSFVMTGNDNCSDNVEDMACADYEHIYYFKGN